MSENMKRILQQQTMIKSSLFQKLLFKYLLKPYIFILKKKSTDTVRLSKNSIMMNIGLSATLNPSTIVIIISMQHVTNNPI